VTILELQNQVIPGFDKEIADILESELKQQGVTIIKGVLISGAAMSKNKLKKIVTFKIDGKEQTISADEIVVAVGREPVMSGVSPQKLGLDLNNVPMKGIKVNCHMETNLSNVYAVGDVTGEIMLAHVASAQAEVAAYNALRDEAARPKVMDYKSIPSCVYTSPEVAFVGLTEEQAMKKVDVEVGRFPFSASGKARLLGEIGGMVKIIADKKYGEVLGVHIIGSRATDMIAEAVLGMNMEITIDELANTVHPHPTLSEGVMEAALSLSGGAIHIP
jgi:dihydrolipoamide dehydrogenase